MSQPITWRNVDAPDSRSAPRFMEGAVSGVNTGFDAFNKIIQQRQNIDQANVAAQDNVNKQNYLDLMQSFKTPEDFAAAQASGKLDAARSILGAASRDSTRGAAEARETSLRANLTAAQQFGIAQQDLRDAPTLEKAARLRSAGKTEEADAVLAANPLLRVTSPAIAANRVEALKRVQDARTVIQNQQVDVLAAVKSPNDLARERLVAQLQPVTDGNAVTETKLKTTQLGLQTSDAANQVLDRQLEAATAGVAQKYQNDQLAGRKQLGVLAAKRGYPLDSAGAPDITNMTKIQRLQLDADSLLAGGKTSSVYFGGDTNAGETHLSNLRKDPGFTPESITRNQAKIVGAFNTVANGAPIGNDALSRATALAQADVVQKEKDGRNRFAPGSPDALNAYEDLSKQVTAALPDDVKEDDPHLQAMLARFATKGIEIRPGVFITPSAKDIMGEVKGYTTNFGGNFLNKTRADDIETNLKKTLKGADVTKLLADAEESRMANRQRDVRNILNPLTPAMAPLNPLNLPPQAPPPRR